MKAPPVTAAGGLMRAEPAERAGGEVALVPGPHRAAGGTLQHFSNLAVTGAFLLTPVMALWTWIWMVSAVQYLATRSPLPSFFGGAWFWCGPPLFAGLVGGLLAAPALQRSAERRRFLRVRAQAPAMPAVQRGRRVRLVGTVRARASTLSTRAGDAAVLLRYFGVVGARDDVPVFHRMRWELHAVDFAVVEREGSELHVDAAHIRLLPHPPSRALLRWMPVPWPAPGTGPDGAEEGAWIYAEESVGPGDLVELAGVLDVVVDATAALGSDREPRLVRVLRGEPGRPLQVRRVSSPPPDTAAKTAAKTASTI